MSKKLRNELQVEEVLRERVKEGPTHTERDDTKGE